MPSPPAARPSSGSAYNGAMYLPRVIRAVSVFGLIGLLSAGCSSTRKELPYPEEISVERGVKDKMLGSASDSPITADHRQQFLPLAYFPVDEGYRVPAVLVPAPGEQALEMPTS